MTAFNIIMAIIGGVGGLFGGVSIWQLMTFRSQVRKEHAEAKTAEDNELRGIIEEMRSEIARLTEEVDRLKAINAEYDSRTYFAENLLCVHKGCAMRKPELGAGRDYWQARHDDGDLECDAKSTQALIAEYEINVEG